MTKAGDFRSGWAKVDITPPLSVPYLSYNPRHAQFCAVHDRLFARAAAFDDGQSQVVIISADAIGFRGPATLDGQGVVADVRKRIRQRTGVPEHNVMIACTHAHSTPETLAIRPIASYPGAQEWLEELMEQLARVACEALANTKRCHVRFGTGSAPGIARNRRVIGDDGRIMAWAGETPGGEFASGPVDNQVGVLVSDAIDDRSLCVATHFTCHPVTVQVQPMVSADFPGDAMRRIESTVSNCDNALFLQGACGNINPMRNTSGFDDVALYGSELAREVASVLRALVPDSGSAGMQPVVGAASKTLSLDARPIPDWEACERGAVGRQNANAAESETLARAARLAEDSLYARETWRDRIPSEVQVFRVGDVAIVGLPGEPFVELAAMIRRSSMTDTLVLGCTNEYIGYVPFEAAYEQGGYELTYGVCSVKAGSGELLVRTALRLIEGLWGN